MNPYCQLAKDTVEVFIKSGKKIESDKNLPEIFFTKKAGVFVSIHNKEELRGCIGTYLPTKDNITKEIISSAISACKDSRFLPIEINELPFLSYEVYILEEPKMIENFDELNPKRYGILVQSHGRSGLLLPDLEGVNTIEQQIEISCQKAGINPEEEKISIFKFLAKKYVSD
jgi:AmmeMemoRadiSam system protein A